MIDPQRKAKIKWQCRRGMLELDLILNNFITYGLNQLTDDQLNHFEILLTATDPQLYSWLMGHEKPHDAQLGELLEFIKMHDQFQAF